MARRYTDLQLACAVAESNNVSEVCRRLGIVPRGGNYSSIKRRIDELGLSTAYFAVVRRSGWSALAAVDDPTFAAAVEKSRSIAEIFRRLDLPITGSGYRTFHRRVKELGLDTSHFMGQAWLRGRSVTTYRGRPLHEVLVDGRPCASNNLRHRLLKEGIKEARCEVCGRETWEGRPIPLELDHVNGRCDDNRFENLRLVCPNCHAQTDTFRGRNIGSRNTTN